MEQLNLSLPLCQTRQTRVARILQTLRVDQAIFVTHDHVQYLTGFRPHRLMQAAVCVTAEGQCTLAAPNEQPGHVQADHVVTFPAQFLATLRQDQAHHALLALRDKIGACRGRAAVEYSGASLLVAQLFDCNAATLVDIDPEMWSLRRRKDRDELELIQRAIACTEAMYERAREIIQPGIEELEVFRQLQSVAVAVAGEPLTALGNDFQCGTPGGAPRCRPVQSGELYILDLGPAYRGYYADNCRTIAVDGTATDEQHRAWERIMAVLEMVEQTVRPNVFCREVFGRAKEMLGGFLGASFFHHLGHGFGLFPHEAPHLNPHWDDVFQEGDCFTAEPGLYSNSLRGGIRLEQDYVVTPTGVRRLTDFSLDL